MSAKIDSNNIHINPDNVEPTITRIQLFLEDKEWEDAIAYCNVAMDYFPTEGRLYLLRMLSEEKISKIDEVIDNHIKIYDNSNYNKVLRFSDENTKKQVEDISKNVKAYYNNISSDLAFEDDNSNSIVVQKDAESINKRSQDFNARNLLANKKIMIGVVVALSILLIWIIATIVSNNSNISSENSISTTDYSNRTEPPLSGVDLEIKIDVLVRYEIEHLLESDASINPLIDEDESTFEITSKGWESDGYNVQGYGTFYDKWGRVTSKYRDDKGGSDFSFTIILDENGDELLSYVD